jgi:hypothetical protein
MCPNALDARSEGQLVEPKRPDAPSLILKEG